MKIRTVILRGLLVLLCIPFLFFVLMSIDSALKRPYIIRAGEYTGRVQDQATGQPIADAAVYIALDGSRKLNYLEFELDSSTTEFFIGEVLMHTDAAGRYRGPEQTMVKWVHWRMRKPNLSVLIGKKGYVAYSNHRYFNGSTYLGKDDDFRAEDLTVVLWPWVKGYSADGHYFFTSGGIMFPTATHSTIVDEIMN